MALSRSLEATRQRAGFDALVLADPSGLAIAGAGSAGTCDELAARAAVKVATRPANDTVPCRLDVVARAFQVRRFRIDGVEILLSAAGGDDQNSLSLAEAAAACQRILGRAGRSSSGGCPVG